MAVSRGARAGCSTAFALSCARMSGEALTSAHWRSSPPLTAIEDWVLGRARDRKSTRLNSSHGYISYAVFCLKKKKTHRTSHLRDCEFMITTSTTEHTRS